MDVKLSHSRWYSQSHCDSKLELGFGLVIMGEVHKSWVRLICFFLRKGLGRLGVSVAWWNFFFEAAWLR